MGGESPLLDEWMMGAEEEGGPSVRSGLGREGPALAKEGSVMGGLVIEEEPVAVKGPDVNERDRRGMGLRTESLARVEAELKRLRELYPVRERERERTPNRRREVQEGETPGSLYDRDGFLKD
ncbi:hypothetical protein MMC08_005761 [Hypocenomyce scalaris]|nr:hypothetical protein [Hypocenomyce scalaris]